MKNIGKTKSQGDKNLSRRNFIGRVGAASAALTIIPRHVLGGVGYTAPRDLIISQRLESEAVEPVT
jgi:hypothetical protein